MQMSTGELHTVGSTVMWMNLDWAAANGDKVNDLCSGAAIGYDHNGVALPATRSSAALLSLVSESQKIRFDIADSTCKPRYKSTWNLHVGRNMSEIITGDLIEYNASHTAIDVLSIATKLQQFQLLLSYGMLAKAASVLQAVAQDAFLTSTRISKYSAMLTSADAFSAQL